MQPCAASRRADMRWRRFMVTEVLSPLRQKPKRRGGGGVEGLVLFARLVPRDGVS